MMPTFNPRGDVALLEHVSVWSGLGGGVAPGDVVLARSAQNPRHMVCKRVLGLEGDTGACRRWGWRPWLREMSSPVLERALLPRHPSCARPP